VLNTLDEAIADLTRAVPLSNAGNDGRDLTPVVNKRALLDNLDLVFLAIDEIIDDGHILETDSFEVVSRVSMASAVKDIPLAEQTLSQTIGQVKQQLIRSFS